MPEVSPSAAVARVHPITWMLLVLPFGISQGYAQVAVPYVLRLRGIDMAVVGGAYAIATSPNNWKLFWTPVLDAGWPRKNWYFLTAALTAFFLAITCLIPPDEARHVGPISLFTLYIITLTLSQIAACTSTAAVLGIMAGVVAEGEKGRASGWMNMGNVGGTAIGGAFAVWLFGHTGPVTSAVVLSVCCVLCIVPALGIVEAPIEKHPALKAIAVLSKDLWAAIKSRPGWTGLIICLSPVGTGAMLNLCSALALDYSPDPATRENMVVYATGLLGGIVSAGGAFFGGYICDKMNRRLAYVIFGIISALCALAMIVAPANPTAFTIGCLAYSFCNGVCYTAFYAFVFDMIGTGKSAATKFALFVCASNQAITYVTWLDGKSYDWGKALWPTQAWGGRAGLLGMDALSTFVGVAVLGVMILVVRKMGIERADAGGETATAA